MGEIYYRLVKKFRKIYLFVFQSYYALKIKKTYLHKKMIKLHIGCGTIYKKGWINIDDNLDKNIEKLDLRWNLANELPFSRGSVNFVYNEHFIEHLSYSQGQSFLKNIYKILKPGGVMRIACPDLDYIIDGYNHDNWRLQSWVTKYGLQGIKSRCEMINVCLNIYPWGHQYVYNMEDLVRALKEAGFESKKIKKVSFGVSKLKELKNIDIRENSLIIEATK